MEAKIVRVGNSKGLRLPKRVLAKYDFGDTVLLQELENGLLIKKEDKEKLSWEKTYKAMAKSEEDWSDWAEVDIEEMD